MATTAYEDALRAVERLTPEERRRLRSYLMHLDLADGPPSGAAFIDALLASPPLDPAGLDAMEQAINTNLRSYIHYPLPRVRRVAEWVSERCTTSERELV